MVKKNFTITDITPREEKKDETETRFQTGGCYPIQVQTLQDGDTQLLVKTFLVPQDTDPQTLLEEGLIRRGISYQVSDILCRELPGETERKEVSKTVTTSAETDESEELLSANRSACGKTPPERWNTQDRMNSSRRSKRLSR